MGRLVQPFRKNQRLTVTLDAGFPIYIEGRAGFSFKPTEPLIKLTASRTQVQGGDKINLKFLPSVQIGKWELPYGWNEPQEETDGTYCLKIPVNVAAGTVQLQAIAGSTDLLRIPLVLHVQPKLIRR